jgi:type VI secretion system (T6SS) VasI/EvfG family protein
MRAPLIAIMLAGAGGAVCAQPADEGSKMLDACFQLARAADAVCSEPKIGEAGRRECRQRANMAQLDCLERVFPGRSAGSAPPEASPRPASPETPTVAASPEVPASSASSDKPIGPAAKGDPTGSQQTPAEAAAVETSTAAVSPEMTTGNASPDMPARRVDIPAKPPGSNWIVSETTSPLDYSPLVTAVIRSSTGSPDAPNTLVIRCVGPRTEVLLRTQGTWRISRSGKVQVNYQIDDQTVVKLPWNISADGKTASYGNDAVGFLQSLPEGARLKINVLDKAGPGPEATFELAGLDDIRKRMASPCKWMTAADKISSGKR